MNTSEDRVNTKKPRVTELVRSEYYFEGRYKQHEIRVERGDCLCDWYIRVRDKRGCYVYDGWWSDSGHKSLDDAIVEACDGAMLLPTRAAAEIGKAMEGK